MPNKHVSVASSGCLADEQVARLADLIVDDRCPFPEDLPAADLDRLRSEVKCRLRRRLIRHIARAVALRLHSRDAGHHSEVPENA